MLGFNDYANLFTGQVVMPLTLPGKTIEQPMQGDFAAVPVYIVDGDTVDVCFLQDATRIRLSGVDAFELPGEKGELAKEFVLRSVKLGQVCRVRLNGKGKFGRTLGDVDLGRDRWLAEALIAEGLGRPYHGGKR